MTTQKQLSAVNRQSINFFMDIWLIETKDGTTIRPESIHGMLWLQTHFEDSHWEALASKQVKIPVEDARFLGDDAKAAGLTLNYLPALSITRNF